MGNKLNKPEIYQEGHKIYLDKLHETESINMFGIRAYIVQEFGISKRDANIILTY